MAQDLLEKTKDISAELMDRLGLEVEIQVEKTDRDQIKVSFDDEDLGILIGYHGENLEALQSILSLMVTRDLDDYQPLIVDAGGYRQERVDRLEEQAQRLAEKARFLSTPVSLSPMSSYERRVVHLKVEQIEGVTSESEGDGWERHVVIKPEE